MLFNIFTDSRTAQISKAFLDEAIFTCAFDVTEGILDEDVITKDGTNLIKEAGLTCPCHFDELSARLFKKTYCYVIRSSANNSKALTCHDLIELYKNGEKRLEETYYFPETKIYHRITYFIVEDKNKHISAFAAAFDVTSIEQEKVKSLLNAHEKLETVDETLNTAGIGIWKITLFDNQKPRMSGSDMMYQLLGLQDPAFMSEEEIYEAWHSRIKKSAIPSVNSSVNEMIEDGKSENTYAWIHPDKGEIFVRCGGTSRFIEGKGYILSGYHSDVTDLITAEIKQKQLLSDALSETNRQKQLLQKALDDYKQADYDRRTDFLTGLHSRQDLYELINDPLSAIRSQIKAVFMLDIDDFQKLNDHYGHKKGDECLQSIGAKLNEYGKFNNLYFYRYGGEEIAAVYFGGDKSANDIADAIVDLIFDMNIERDDVSFGRVTISVGYTCGSDNFEKMLDIASKARYVAKDNGKNQAVLID